MKLRLFLFLFIICTTSYSQGLNHVVLLGNQWLSTEPKGRMFIDNNAMSYLIEYRKMAVEGTQATICDSTGNFLMSSNGVWIADATNDTMLNGAGLNPGQNVNAHPYGLLDVNANIIIPKPTSNDSYYLLHHTVETSWLYDKAYDILLTEVDANLNNGLGGIVSKNQIIFSDSLTSGLAACKHANGVDWWIAAKKDSSNDIYSMLIDKNGFSTSIKSSLNYSPIGYGIVEQIKFNQAGNKILLSSYDNPINRNSYIIIADFDRCTGQFSNAQAVHVVSGKYLWGLCFSASGNFVYACSTDKIFQINSSTYTVDTVANYDGFYYPIPQAPTSFGLLYLGADSKIYCTSLGSVQHMHVINQPDSAGIGCDVQQHSIFLNFWNFRSVPNHPNYYLGCDTTLGCGCATSYNQYSLDDDKFKIYPNPNNGSFNIGYKAIATSSLLKVIDVNGKVVYEQYLAPWSNEQSVRLKNVTVGIYLVVIQNGNSIVSKKMVVMDE